MILINLSYHATQHCCYISCIAYADLLLTQTLENLCHIYKCSYIAITLVTCELWGIDNIILQFRGAVPYYDNGSSIRILSYPVTAP